MKDNITLIGFMGSGKTTIGKAWAKLMEMKFVDIDKVIEAHEKKSVAKIFEEKGQIYFRDLEREVISQEALRNNCVIATGGGSILDNENVKRLKETSFIVFFVSFSIGVLVQPEIVENVNRKVKVEILILNIFCLLKSINVQPQD